MATRILSCPLSIRKELQSLYKLCKQKKLGLTILRALDAVAGLMQVLVSGGRSAASCTSCDMKQRRAL